MGKKKPSQNEDKRLAAPAPSSVPTPVANQGNHAQQQSPPFQLTGLFQIAPGAVSVPGDSEQLSRQLMDGLDEICRINLGELNTSETLMMQLISDLKEKQKVLSEFSSSSDIENLKAEQITTINTIVVVLERLCDRNDVIRKNTQHFKRLCCDVRRLINEFETRQANLARKLQDLTDGEQANQERIKVLEKALNAQGKTICTLTEQNVENVKELGELRDEVRNLKDTLNVTELGQAQLVLRQLLTEVTTLMYKKLFPEKSLPKKKTYTMSEIRAEVNKLKTKAKTDENLRKNAEDKQYEFDKLLKDLNWEDDMEDTIIRIKESTQCNEPAHPKLENAESVRSNLDKLLKEYIDEDDHAFCLRVLEMWTSLGQPG